MVWDDFVKLVHLVGHPGESYIYIIGMRLVGLINPHNLSKLMCGIPWWFLRIFLQKYFRRGSVELLLTSNLWFTCLWCLGYITMIGEVLDLGVVKWKKLWQGLGTPIKVYMKPMEAYGAHHEWAMLALLLRVRLRFLGCSRRGSWASNRERAESSNMGIWAPLFHQICLSGWLSAVLAGNDGKGWLDMLGITSKQDRQ